jgi:hypothetical protein
MPVGWGGALPGIAVSVKATTKGESSSVCIPSQKSGASDQAIDADSQQNNKELARFPASQGSSELVHPAVLQNSQNDEETRPASSDRSRKPWVVLNAAGRECGHYERCWPPLAYSHEDMTRMGLLCRSAEAPIGKIEDVVEWLKDYGVAANLMSPILTSFEWPGEISIREASKLHSFGKWYRFELRQPQPSPIAGTNTTSSTKYSHPWADYRRCIHATSLYVLPSILHKGLLPGKHPGRGGVRGVYCYEMITHSLAVKSSQYCVYTSPQGDGVFWGPRLELQVALGCAMHHRKSISVGQRQYAAFEGSYTVTALWVHVITQDELQLAWKEIVRLWYVLDAWRAEFLVPRDVVQ